VAKNLFSISISGNSGYGRFAQSMLEAKTVALFEKWQKKSIGFEVSRDVAEGMMPILKMVEFTKSVSSKEFQNAAKAKFEERLEIAQRNKFNTRGYRKWAPLKPSTKRWRNYISQKEGFESYGLFALWGYPPLTFSGALRTAVSKGLMITKFNFFSETDYRKGYLKLSNLNIGAKWEEPRIETRQRYFHMTANSIQTFRDLIERHRRTGRYAFLTPTLDVMKGDTVDFTQSLTRGEFFRYVWSPFVRKDFEELFKKKRFKAGSPEKIVSETLNIGSDIVNNLDKEGTVSADMIQKRVQELMKKREKMELTKEEWDFLVDNLEEEE